VLAGAAVAAALAVASPAGAATARVATKPGAASTPATTGTPSLAAGTPRAVPQARSAPATPVPSAPALRAPPPRVAFAGAGLGALSAFGTGGSILVQLDYAVQRTPPAWRRLDLEWHVLAAFARPTGEKGLTAQVVPPLGLTPVSVNAGREKVSALLFEVIPTARVVWTAAQGVAFFGDAGLGLAQTFESYDRTELYLGHSTRREYATGFVLRLGAGMALEVAPRWRVLFEPLSFDLMVGPKFSAWTPTLGVAYRL
jgi:hypothetical protein